MFNTTAFSNFEVDLFSNVRKKHQPAQQQAGMGAPDWGSSSVKNSTENAWSFNLQS